MLLIENLDNKDSHKDENENHLYSPHSEVPFKHFVEFPSIFFLLGISLNFHGLPL